MPPLEAGQPRFREQLHGFADILVPVLAALLHEDHLIHPRLLELPQMPLDLLGRADRARAAASHRQEVAGFLVVLPNVRAAGQVLAEDVIMAERVAEEAEAVEAAPARFLRVGVTGEAAD